MPSLPSWLDKPQFILFYAMNPCDADISLYVEMAKEPVGKLALMLVTLDASQIVQNFFQPKNLRTKRHGRKGRRGGQNRRGFLPDVDDLVAEKLPGIEDMNMRPVGSGGRWILHGINAYERIVWPMFLIDQVGDTVFDTIMGVMESDKAVCPNIGRMLRRKFDGIFTGIQDWHAVNLPDLRYEFNVTTPNGFVAGVGAGTFTCTFSVTIHNGPVEDTRFRCGLVQNGDFNNPIDMDGYRDVPKNSEVQFITNATVTGPTQIQWYAEVETGTVGFTFAEMLILQIGN